MTPRSALPALATTPAGVAVLGRILTHGPIPRIEIARSTGLSQAAVTKAVSPLIESGYVEEFRGDRGELSGAGRPVNPLSVAAGRLLVIGVKITADEAIGVITDLSARILSTVHRPLVTASVEEVIETASDVVQWLRQEQQSVAERIVGVGVTVSGDVNSESGLIRHSPLLGWRDIALGDELSARIGLPVIVENDVRALTIAEHWFGLGVDSRSFAVVTIGTGVGCGIYVNGEVVSGASGVSGEIGHLPLASGNLVCTCGRRGCVETVASSQAILSRIRSLTGQAVDMAGAVALAHAGDERAISAFAEAGEVIGSALAAMVNLVGPELVVIAGEGVADYELYEGNIRRTFGEHAFGAAAECELVVRSHTFDDWARGAAAAVIREIVRSGLPV
jgi:predicted NBD/HSP70 family sugar kinase